MPWKIKTALATLALSVLTLGTLPRSAPAGNDPSIEGKLREDIRTTMTDYVTRSSIDGVLWHYDPLEQTLLELKLQELHEGIVRKGSFYVSCADFVDQNGRTVDVDILLATHDGRPVPALAILHKIDGKKRPYDVERIESASDDR